MKIQFCSDLHLEFSENRQWMKDHPLIPKADILVIAGDTYYLGRDFRKLHFIKKVADNYEMVYLIPGNHEYYAGYDVATALESTHEEIMDNVIMVNNTTVEVQNVQLIFSTMWSRITRNFLRVLRGLNDFRKIKFQDQNLSIDHFNQLHDYAFNFLENAVAKTGKKVVVTHHLPSERCNVREFKNSLLNEGFCVDYTRFIEQSDVQYWLYGHSHRNKKPIDLNGTQLISNQLGYVGYGEYQSFSRDKVISI